MGSFIPVYAHSYAYSMCVCVCVYVPILCMYIIMCMSSGKQLKVACRVIVV